MLDAIVNTAWTRIWVMLFLSCALVCPGFLLIAIFWPHQFQSLDLFRLVVLALSATLPVFLTNMFVTFKSVLERDIVFLKIEREERIALSFMLSAVFTLPSFYLPILIKFYVPALGPRTGVTLVLAIQTLAVVLLIGKRRRAARAILSASAGDELHANATASSSQ